ncbi:MAG: hypothetical protein ACRD1R_17085 [Acidobacteriota bacterium]
MITAGAVAENPIELLSHPRMGDLIKYLKTEFDTIILDSPPLQPISDARILSHLSDGPIMVVRTGQTPYGSIEKALKSISPKKFLGVVLNDVKPIKYQTNFDHRYYQYKNDSHYPYARNGGKRL